jgi:hypothetical protein
VAKNINNLDKSLKQNITPADIGAATTSSVTAVSNNIGALSNLQTNEKSSLVGAINELFQNANSGKQLIADAIGEPLSKDDTFSAMSNDINSLLFTFKTNMMNNGVTVNSSDRFKSLIDKIATIADSEGSKGVQYASGSTVGGSSVSNRTLSVNLAFKPIIIYAQCYFKSDYYDFFYTDFYFNEYVSPTTINYYTGEYNNPGAFEFSRYIQKEFDDNIYVTDNSFNFYYKNSLSGNYSWQWYAIGIGEEDTALRDSLADILENKGIDVTEEDNMASLITKVDDMTSNMIKYKSGFYEYTYDGNVRISLKVTGIGFRPTFVQVCRVNKSVADGGYLFWINNGYMYDSNSIYIPTDSTRDINSSYKSLNASANSGQLVVNDDGFSLDIIVGGMTGHLWHFEWFVLG